MEEYKKAVEEEIEFWDDMIKHCDKYIKKYSELPECLVVSAQDISERCQCWKDKKEMFLAEKIADEEILQSLSEE
ncbi:MAG: hypothetical protein NC124_03945 [Clostridium sp.]|nr:hypothetical protein [Clostridium sp.]